MRVSNQYLLALDVDRTLLTDDFRLLPQVSDAVQRARKAGVNVALATARGPAAVDVILKALGEIDYAICFGGALILKRTQGAWSSIPSSSGSANTIESAKAASIASRCLAMGLSVAAYGQDDVYVEERDSKLADDFAHLGDKYVVCGFADLPEPLFKFLVISSLTETNKLVLLQGELAEELSCAMSHVNFLEVGPRHVTKGSGLAELAKSIGVDQQHTVAIGDSENDIPMLAYAGLSIAMGNASQKVRDAARWTTASNADAGVAVAIDRLFKETSHLANV